MREEALQDKTKDMPEGAFSQTPGSLAITLVTVGVLTVLVLVEKNCAHLLKGWGVSFSVMLTFAVNASKTLLPLVLLYFVLRQGPDCLGWIRGGVWQTIWKALVVTALMMAIFFLYRQYSHLLFGTPYVMTGKRAISNELPAITFVLGASSALVNAFGEEIVFRGMLFPILLNKANLVAALVVQSLVFTGYHFFPLQNSVLLFIMGIAFGASYLWSRSLLTPVLAHLLMNATAVIGMTVTYMQTR